MASRGRNGLIGGVMGVAAFGLGLGACDQLNASQESQPGLSKPEIAAEVIMDAPGAIGETASDTVAAFKDERPFELEGNRGEIMRSIGLGIGALALGGTALLAIKGAVMGSKKGI